jgi:hypothetical protein
MKASPFRSGKVAPPRMSAEDREFENLLQRAPDFLKNRRSPEVSGSLQQANHCRDSLILKLDSQL